MTYRFAGFVASALFAFCASGQEGWGWRGTPYLWGSAINGDIALGSVGRDTDVEFSDGRPLAIDTTFLGATVGFMFD